MNECHRVIEKLQSAGGGAPTGLSGANRQRKYRRRIQAVSIDVGRATADLIRVLRRETNLTTDVVLMRALGAFQKTLGQNGGQVSNREPATHRRSGKSAHFNAMSAESSLGDGAIEHPIPGTRGAAASHTFGAKRALRGKTHAPAEQGKLNV
jgi:hypothetical protein